MSEDELVKEDLLKQKTIEIIVNEVKKIRNVSAETKKEIQVRWIWELIQNAVDCCYSDKRVEIKITYDSEAAILNFTHNGHGFTSKALWGIVTQTSSKQASEETVGQFGTGFLTTTLLASKIEIESFLENDKNNEFTLELDRSGETYEAVKKAVNRNFKQLDYLLHKQSDIYQSERKTNFKYDLNVWKNTEKINVAKEAVKEGIKSLLVHLPYLLCTSPKIKSITINKCRFSLNETEMCIGSLPGSKVMKMSASNQRYQQYIFMYNLSNGSLLAPVCLVENNNFKFQKTSDEVSRLSCNFPLIGTNNYPIPLFFDSPNLDVKMDRNAIFEGSADNQKLIGGAIEGYKAILKTFGSSIDLDPENICLIKGSGNTQYQRQIKNRITKFIKEQVIVPTNYGLKSILNNGKEQIFVPLGSQKVKSKEVWELANRIKHLLIPTKEKFEVWRQIINNNLTLNTLQEKYISDVSPETKRNYLLKNNLLSEWLNSFFELCSKCEDIDFLKNLKIPAADGYFKNVQNIRFTKDTDDQLIDLLILADPKLKEELVFKGIIIPKEIQSYAKIMDRSSIAKIIEEKVIIDLSENNEGTRSPDVEHFFAELLKYLKLNKEAKTILPKAYERRNSLRPISFEKNLNTFVDLAEDKNISLEELISLLKNEDLTYNEDGTLSKELKQQLKHISERTHIAKVNFEFLIRRTTKNVYKELASNPKYEVPNKFEDWQKKCQLSTTIYRVTKEGTKLSVVLRPSDGNKIIFYDEAEISTLASDNYELWTDDGNGHVTEVTLGDLLNTTQITEIPLKKLFGDTTNEN